MLKFGTSLPIGKIAPLREFQSGAAVREIAAAIEQAGVSFAGISEHPAPDTHWLHNDPTAHDALDPFTALAFVAAATSTLQVLTNIIVLPFRNPFVTAKAAATLQVLSDNRLIMGVGVGYQQIEFDALGAAFRQRGALTDEAIETIRLAWAGGPVVKQGRNFNAAGNEPRPVPSPAPPIWVGGSSDKALERAARWGDGWIPYFSVPTNDPTVAASSITSYEQYAERIAKLRDLRAHFGQTGPFDISTGSPFRPKTTTRDDADRLIECAHKVAAHGATSMWTPLPAPSRAAFIENVAWYGEEVIARYAKEAG